jgi:hypothetical protein
MNNVCHLNDDRRKTALGAWWNEHPDVLQTDFPDADVRIQVERKPAASVKLNGKLFPGNLIPAALLNKEDTVQVWVTLNHAGGGGNESQ